MQPDLWSIFSSNWFRKPLVCYNPKIGDLLKKESFRVMLVMTLSMMLKSDDFMLFFCLSCLNETRICIYLYDELIHDVKRWWFHAFFCFVMLEVGCYKVYFFISNNLMICGTFVNISLTHVMSCNTTWINNNNNKQAWLHNNIGEVYICPM